MSRDIAVMLDGDKGLIFAGIRRVGTVMIEQVEKP
jgi:hypothetical protein